MFFMVVVTILNNNSIQKVGGSCHLMWNPTESLSTITFISEHCFLAASPLIEGKGRDVELLS